MGINAALLGHDVTTGKVVNIDATANSIHTVSAFDPMMIGNVNYGPTNRQRGFVFGRRTIVNNTLADLWDGPTEKYVFPTVAQQMRVVSTSASDAAAGIGARTIHIHYLDENYLPREETLTLNGVTPVLTTATNMLRINLVHVGTVGSNQTTVGAISITNTAGTVTYSYLAPNWNIARQAIYTVPDGVTGYITHWQNSSGSTGQHFCTITMRATSYTGGLVPGVMLVQDEMGSQNGGTSINFPTPIVVPARADVKLTAISDAANANVTALGAIMGYFETNI